MIVSTAMKISFVDIFFFEFFMHLAITHHSFVAASLQIRPSTMSDGQKHTRWPRNKIRFLKDVLKRHCIFFSLSLSFFPSQSPTGKMKLVRFFLVLSPSTFPFIYSSWNKRGAETGGHAGAIASCLCKKRAFSRERGVAVYFISLDMSLNKVRE